MRGKQGWVVVDDAALTPSTGELDHYERHLIEQIEELQRSYRKAAQPLWTRLIELRNLRPLPVIMVAPEGLEPPRREDSRT